MLPVKKKSKAVGKGVFARALSRFKTESKQRMQRAVRIGFLIDATSSRAHTWAQAQKIQSEMFASVSGFGAMALRLVHFGGGAVIDHGWMDSPHEVASAMRNVKCVAGYTQILQGLRTFLESDELPGAIILVGDMFEVNPEEVAGIARELERAGVKIFSFLEGSNENADRTFRHLAQITGGTFASFGAELPLRDLCEGVALLTAGGEQAVECLGNKNVKRLLLSGPPKEQENK